MAERLENLERAEELVIGILEAAGNAIGELKEIQANDEEKTMEFVKHTVAFYDQLKEVKEILLGELNELGHGESTTMRRPGIDHLAIADWEAKVVADNLHKLIDTE